MIVMVGPSKIPGNRETWVCPLSVYVIKGDITGWDDNVDDDCEENPNDDPDDSWVEL